MKRFKFKILLITFLLEFSISCSSSELIFGLSDENLAAAKNSLNNIKVSINNTIKFVSNEIYPNMKALNVKISAPLDDTLVLADLVKKQGSLIKLLDSKATKTSAYIAKLAVIESGLRIQMQFISNDTKVHLKFPIFEALANKRIIISPVFNVNYDSYGNVLFDDQITSWECISDSDEAIDNSSGPILEGMRSVVSLAGGVLKSCQYLSSGNMDKIWVNI